MRKLIRRIKERIKARRIRRFKASFKEAYPDAARFMERVAWLDGTDQFVIDATINVPEVLLWTSPAHEESERI